jgi:hypothetical protein
MGRESAWRSTGPLETCVIRAILDNPIAVREWRVLRRRAGDWRIWVGLKWSVDPIVWGAPVVLTYALGPYGLWAVLAFLGRLRLVPPGGLPLDPFFMLALVFWFYVVAISLVLGATAVTREREQQTWDQVRITPHTGHERAMGLLWGRLGPVWISFALAAGPWWLSQPLASAWLAPGIRPVLSRGEVVPVEALILWLSVLAGQFGLLASARSKSTAVAVVFSALIVAPFVLLVTAVLGAVLSSGGDLYVNAPANERTRWTVSLLVFLGFLISLPIVFLESLERRLDVS